MESVFVVKFNVQSEAFQALTELRQQPANDDFVVSQACLVNKKDGRITMLDQFDTGMESVNDINFMSSGSTTYSPAVYAVGAYSPSRPTTAIRRGAPPSTGTVTEDTFKNPQFSPIGDAVLPFILMAFSYILFRLVKRKDSLSLT